MDQPTLICDAAPVGIEAIGERYGTAGLDRCRSATVSLPAAISGVTELRCHPAAVEAIHCFFETVHEQGLWHCLNYIDGPFVVEGRRGTFPPQLLLTAWGAGFKLNERENRFHSVPPPDMPASTPLAEQPGRVFFKTHPVVEIARGIGFTWGGDDAVNPFPALFEYGRY